MRETGEGSGPELRHAGADRGGGYEKSRDDKTEPGRIQKVWIGRSLG